MIRIRAQIECRRHVPYQLYIQIDIVRDDMALLAVSRQYGSKLCGFGALQPPSQTGDLGITVGGKAVIGTARVTSIKSQPVCVPEVVVIDIATLLTETAQRGERHDGLQCYQTYARPTRVLDTLLVKASNVTDKEVTAMTLGGVASVPAIAHQGVFLPETEGLGMLEQFVVGTRCPLYREAKFQLGGKALRRAWRKQLMQRPFRTSAFFGCLLRSFSASLGAEAFRNFKGYYSAKSRAVALGSKKKHDTASDKPLAIVEYGWQFANR